MQGEAGFDATSESVPIRLESASARESLLFKAIPDRQCTRGEFDGHALSIAELRLLESAASSEQVGVLVLTERGVLEQVLEYVIAGNTAQIADPAFVAELKAWIRFSEAAAVRSGDGLYAASSDNPTMPTWLGRRMFDVFFLHRRIGERQVREGDAQFRGPSGVRWQNSGQGELG